MKRNHKKLALNRDTMRNLSGQALQEAAGGGLGTAGCTFYVTCPHSCAGSCITCTVCPSCGQNCTVYC
jgi:hypothetical protein